MDGDDEAIVTLDGVWRTYGEGALRVDALRDVGLRVSPGSLVAVLGPSGSGKTTLLNLVGGIDRPTQGNVVVDGREVSAMGERDLNAYRRASVGFVFQFFNLIPNLTAEENVRLAADLVDRPRDTLEVLKEVGLGDRAGRFPGQLSGGEQQRVAIARALVKDPSIILCDEPTGELDYRTGRAVLANLRAAGRDEGRTVLLVTHNSAVARIADRIVRLSGGRVAEDEPNPSPVPPSELRW